MTNGDTLSNDHRLMLEQDSGISPNIIEVRGYRTLTKKVDLKSLGFAGSQSRVPTLLIPVWGVAGEVVTYQTRPDDPRIQKGRVVKYELPAGTKMVLDVHPSVRSMLGDPKIPLWITEGVKKGDALVSQGCCAIALLGVWNWRGANDEGGKTVLADWEHIALNGRQIYIAFDSDVMAKPEVHQALARLKTFLESKT